MFQSVSYMFKCSAGELFLLLPTAAGHLLDWKDQQDLNSVSMCSRLFYYA